MADFTPNYNLKKPLRTEYYDVGDANGNSDIVDTQLKAVNDRVGLVEGEVDALELGKVDKVVGQGLSDENYTLIEKNKVANLPDDTNAQLAEKVQNFKIKNELPVGIGKVDTISGFAGFGGAVTIVRDTGIFLFGTGSLSKSLGTSSTGMRTPGILANENDVFYAKFHIYGKGTSDVIWHIRSLSDVFLKQLRVIRNLPLEEYWKPVSFVFSTDQNCIVSVGAIHTFSPPILPSDFNLDGFSVINLTKTFGTGNEPTKLEMDELIKVIPNQWWDGELSLTQKQVVTWQLNLIRKNTNAIIALGGTII